MNVARHDHTATLLPDGRVLIVGGYPPSFQPAVAGSAEIYDPSTGALPSTGSMTTGRGKHQHRHDSAMARCWSPVVTRSTPVALSQAPNSTISTSGTFSTNGRHDRGARSAHGDAVSPNGAVLIAGGFMAFPHLGTTHQSAEVYDPATASFTPTASMKGGRGRHAAVSLSNGDVLVAGGDAECCGGAMLSAEVFSCSPSSTHATDDHHPRRHDGDPDPIPQARSSTMASRQLTASTTTLK